MRLIRFFIGWAVCVGVAPSAWAQFTPNQTQVQAEGFKLGPVVLHPFANADIKYDSNPAYQPRELSPRGDVALRGRVGFRLEADGNLFDLAFNAQGDYTRYLGLSDPQLKQLSALQGSAGLQLGINSDGWLSGLLRDEFSRQELNSPIVIGDTVRFIRNTARASLIAKPGGGALEIKGGYGFDFVLFDERQRSLPDARALSMYNHVVSLTGLWRFFPRTALSVEADQTFTRFFFTSATLPNVSSNPFRVRAGINGQLTDHITVRAMVGYGNSFTQGTSGSYSNVIVSTGVTWEPFDTMLLSLSYARDMSPVSLFGYYSLDKVSLEYRQTFFERLVLIGRGEYIYEQYGRAVVAGLPNRQDHVIRGEARISFNILRVLATGVYYMPEFRLTPYRAPGSNISGQYLRHIVGFDVTLGF